jgi:hypothetical protein
MDEKRLCRWLDGELLESEAHAFLASLTERERCEALALAALAKGAARLPRAAPSQDFAARAMARVRARRRPRRSAWTWLRAPALSPLAALAGAVVIAAGAFGLAGWRGASFTPARAARAPSAVVARLALRAPLAREVAVAADFNGWRPEAAHMRRGEGGVWTLEVPLAPGRRYEYMFVVDGRWVTDPTAPASVEDGFGGRNAVLDL